LESVNECYCETGDLGCHKAACTASFRCICTGTHRWKINMQLLLSTFCLMS